MKPPPPVARSVFYGSAATLLAYCGLRLLSPSAWPLDGLFNSVTVLLGAATAGLAYAHRLNHREQRLRSCFRLILQVSGSLQRQSIVHLALHSAVTLTGAICGCLRLREEADLLRIASTWNAAPDYDRRYHQLSLSELLPDGMEPAPDATLLPERDLPPSVRFLRQSPPLRSALLAPVYGSQSLQGYFVLGFEQPPRLSPDVRLALCALSEQLVNALDNARAYEALMQEANTDPLTTVYCRRYFDALYQLELAQSARTSTPLCVAMIDVDELKPINDRWGHPAGDLVLQTVGSLLKHVFREQNVVARFGGDEFVVLMPNTTYEEATHLLDRVREELAVLNASEKLPMQVSLSLGCEQWGSDTTDLLAKADAAMYRDKQRKGTEHP